VLYLCVRLYLGDQETEAVILEVTQIKDLKGSSRRYSKWSCTRYLQAENQRLWPTSVVLRAGNTICFMWML